MSESKKVGICYDFDGTLIRGNMQENSFIPELGMSKEEFWKEVKEYAKDQDMDEVLAYMHLMMRKTQQKERPFTRKDLQRHGQKVELFPGVKKWFDEINKVGKGLGLEIQHYIISSGIDEMIKGSPIADEFEHIFASGFSYDANDVPFFAARSVNYTTKTQYLYRINKGILNSWDHSVNELMEDDKRPIPFSRMIYLGDGETDIPAMKTVNYQGGYSIVVYPPASGQRLNKKERNKKESTEKIYCQNRAQFIAEANYEEGSELYEIVCALIRRISDEEKYKMNRKA